MRLPYLFATGTLLLLAGCHSPVIDATLTNATSDPLRLIEVDYPSASFGVQTLEPGGTFHYRFKVLGSGALKMSWTDNRRQEHASTGPNLSEGSEGKLAIIVSPDGTIAWNAATKPAR